MRQLVGISALNSGSLNGINCCSLGILNSLTGTNFGGSGVIARKGSTLKNCYYLNGVQGTTRIIPEPGATVFYKISENEEDMTTAKVVEKLNEYIRLKGVLAEGDTEVDTTGWCRWKVGENNLPELELDWEWNPTAGENGTGDFVKVN